MINDTILDTFVYHTGAAAGASHIMCKNRCRAIYRESDLELAGHAVSLAAARGAGCRGARAEDVPAPHRQMGHR